MIIIVCTGISRRIPPYRVRSRAQARHPRHHVPEAGGQGAHDIRGRAHDPHHELHARGERDQPRHGAAPHRRQVRLRRGAQASRGHGRHA